MGKGGGPIGNQHAKGSTTNGRPREYDPDWYANNLREWVQDPTKWRMRTWLIEHEMSRETVRRLREQSEVFRDAYAHAMRVIADRREEMCATDELKESLFRMYARMYDRDLDAQCKEEVEHAESVKAKEQKSVQDSVREDFQSAMAVLKAFQADSVLNKASTSNNSDNKSA